MTFKQIRTKNKELLEKLESKDLALSEEKSINTLISSINEFNEKRIKDLKTELAKQYDAKMHIIKNAKKCKEERDLYYKNWIKEIDKKEAKYVFTPFFYFLVGALIFDFAVLFYFRG